MGVLSTGLLSAPAFASDRYADAGHRRGPVVSHVRDDHHADHHEPVYRVLYRTDHHHGWRVSGTYRTADAARHAADDLHHRGYETRVERA